MPGVFWGYPPTGHDREDEDVTPPPPDCPECGGLVQRFRKRGPAVVCCSAACQKERSRKQRLATYHRNKRRPRP